jgi:hypothetical protein
VNTTIERDGRKIALACDGRRILLTPDRADLFALTLLSALRLPDGPARLLLDEQRSAGYRLAVVACPTRRLIAVGNLGQFGDTFAGWTFDEAREAASRLLAVAVEIGAMPVRTRRKAA